MGRRKVEPRTVVVAVRLTEREAAGLDAERGSLSRSEWLRWRIAMLLGRSE